MKKRYLYSLVGVIFLISLLIPFAVLGYLERQEVLSQLAQWPVMLYVVLTLDLLVSILLIVLIFKLHNSLYKREEYFNSILENKEQELAQMKDQEQAEISEEEEKRQKYDPKQYLEQLVPESPDSFQDIQRYARQFLINIADKFHIVQGVFYVRKNHSKTFQAMASYAYYAEEEPPEFQEGEGLTGQVAKEQRILNIPDVPDDYLQVYSGLGKSTPNYLILVPLIDNEFSAGVVELASFKAFSHDFIDFLTQYSSMGGKTLNKLLKPVNQRNEI